MYSFLTALVLTFILLIPMRYTDKRKKAVKVTTMNGIKYYEKHDKWYYLWYLIATMPILFVSAFRDHTVGIDNNGIYYSSFFKAINGIDNNHFEVGFRLLIKVISYITDNYQWFDIITSCIILVLLFWAIDRDSNDIALSYLLFVISGMYIYSLSGIRQYIAISILMFGFKYIYENNFLKYVICVVIASLFHTGILATIVLYVLVNCKKQVITPKLLLLALGLLFVCREIFSILISKILSETRYYAYILSVSDSVFQKFVFIIQLGILIILMINYKVAKNDKKYMLAYWSQSITVATVIFTGIIPEISRVAWYFMAYQIIGIPIAMKYEKNLKRRMIYILGIVAVYVVYFIYDFIYMKYYKVIPYNFCFWS